MPRLVVVLPLAPLALGAGHPLNQWPLHVTVAPTFVVEHGLSTVTAAITPILADQPIVRARAGHEEGFGPSATIPVAVVDPSPELTALHTQLVGALASAGAVFDDPQYVGAGYRPHITATRLAAATAGQELVLRQAVVVDMEPLGDRRLRNVVWVQALV